MAAEAAPSEDTRDLDNAAKLQNQLALASEAAEREIEQEVRQNAVVSEPLPISTLEAVYKENEPFLRKIKELGAEYSSYRAVRGDGNCLYRSYLLSIFEGVAERRDQAEADRLHQLAQSSMEYLLKVGFDELGLEMFYDVFIEMTELLTQLPAVDVLRSQLTSDDVDPYFVQYVRFLTSGYMKSNPETFLPLTEGQSLDVFCNANVEKAYVEADFAQCVALAAFFERPVRIQYLDRSEGGLTAHDIGPALADGAEPTVHLLYRPGHYDVLYHAAPSK